MMAARQQGEEPPGRRHEGRGASRQEPRPTAQPPPAAGRIQSGTITGMRLRNRTAKHSTAAFRRNRAAIRPYPHGQLRAAKNPQEGQTNAISQKAPSAAQAAYPAAATTDAPISAIRT